jgi:hypothetical protein
MPHQNGMPTLAELQAMSAEELGSKVDQQFSMTPAPWRLMLAQIFRDELVRREQDRTTQSMLDYTERMYRYTKQVRNLTWVILVATLLSLFASGVSLWVSLRKPAPIQSQLR